MGRDPITIRVIAMLLKPASLVVSTMMLLSAAAVQAADPLPSTPAAPVSPSLAPGLKQQLEQAGLKLDLLLTGFVQGQASGSDASAEINGLTQRSTSTGSNASARLDALLELDASRVGLWRGGRIHAHLEGENGVLPGWRGGAFWPVNTGAILPVTPPGSWSLSSLYLQQRWGGTRLMLGKVNVIDLQSQSPFFGGWGVERFQNLALVVPPTGVTPLTLMAGSLSQQIGAVTLTAMVYDPSDRAQNTFQGLFANGVNLSLGAQWNGRLWQRRSTLGVTAITSSVRSVSLAETYLPSVLRQQGLTSPSNLTLNVGHQIWASPVRPGQGIGFYGRFGITGGDPNPLQASMAMGVSGAGLWRSRPWDGFGIGVYRSNWSNGLSTTVLTPLQPERGVEMYYNLAITPWLSLMPDLQIIRPATAGAPLLTVLGLRTLLRF